MPIVVVQTAFLGDLVLTTPLLRELTRARGGDGVAAVVTPAGAELLRGFPGVDHLIVFDKRGEARGPRGLARVILKVRELRPVAAIAAQRSFRSGMILRFSGAEVRVGFERATGRWAYTVRVPWERREHAVRRYLALAGSVGGDPETAESRPYLPVLPEARERVEGRLVEAGIDPGEPVLAVSPGSNWGAKRWLPEGYAEVVRAARAIALRPVLVGAPSEQPLCEYIASLSGVDPVILARGTGLNDLVAFLAGARVLVTNDTGPGHVAAAVGTPVVSVFGPTTPEAGLAPYGEGNRIVERSGLDCRPCRGDHGPETCPLGHFRCMREIIPDQVVAAIREVLAEGR